MVLPVGKSKVKSQYEISQWFHNRGEKMNFVVFEKSVHISHICPSLVSITKKMELSMKKSGIKIVRDAVRADNGEY